MSSSKTSRGTSEADSGDRDSAQLTAFVRSANQGRGLALLSIAMSVLGTAWLLYSGIEIAGARQKLREIKDKQAELKGANEALESRKRALAKTNAELLEKNTKLKSQNTLAQEELDDKQANLNSIKSAVERQGSCTSKLDSIEQQVSPNLERARVLWREGYKLFNANNKEAARKKYEESHRLVSWYVSPMNSLGRLELEAGRYTEARSWLEKANRVQPGYAATLHNLALLEKREGNLPKACELVSQALKAQPGYPPSTKLKASMTCTH